jgi:hypothetical protein
MDCIWWLYSPRSTGADYGLSQEKKKQVYSSNSFVCNMLLTGVFLDSNCSELHATLCPRACELCQTKTLLSRSGQAKKNYLFLPENHLCICLWKSLICLMNLKEFFWVCWGPGKETCSRNTFTCSRDGNCWYSSWCRFYFLQAT